MKWYNPLKPHIVEFSDGWFAVRRLTTTGWQYFDNQKVTPDYYWWNSLEFKCHFLVDSLSAAKDVLQEAKNPPPTNKVKVHL